ncbi:5-formyltetrahydrofolate cyclo-ligase [[Phormidium ambiguum] IAM M-71]|uniref:5-formyltetrahydrofolate cyclo-ligase n=1 Tax=[Phormidium ambiguum] IAM M-71 TaxID=454136 RepID=A0A1U7I8F5_9CYAN|nr:5-formyltetrahydrofolate cyclo-ligase [Phormidium ambiguum]OKH32737.1 5-formyltetrahydrofolate cyclo-ligase [Phormidium ambiguum IAM M-71]
MIDRTKTAWSGYNLEKDELRSEIWSLLKQEKATINDPFGHIPNFVGAEKAAKNLAELPVWQQAKTIKCNPDSPQIAVRLQALKEGKRLYMAVPKLTNTRCFVELTAEHLRQCNVKLEEGAIARQALKLGKLVSFTEMQPIDLVIVGCVAVTRDGGRTGKGAGFADLELAMLQTFGLIDSNIPIVTTVHPLQIVPDSLLPMQTHDWSLDWIINSEDVIKTNSNYTRPTGLNWDIIRAEQYQKIPILKHLKKQLKP